MGTRANWYIDTTSFNSSGCSTDLKFSLCIPLVTIVSRILSVCKSTFRMILTNCTKAIARYPLRLPCQSSSNCDRVFRNLRNFTGVVRSQTARLMNSLAWIDMESLGVVLQRLLVEGSTLRIHTLIARLHRGNLISAKLFFLLILIVVESSLNGVSMINHRFHRVILSIWIH